MNVIYRTFNFFSYFYFLSLVILGNFFILNLILGVLKIKHSAYQKNFIEDDDKILKFKFNLKDLKNSQIYIRKNIGINHFFGIYILNKEVANRFKRSYLYIYLKKEIIIKIYLF